MRFCRAGIREARVSIQNSLLPCTTTLNLETCRVLHLARRSALRVADRLEDNRRRLLLHLSVSLARRVTEPHPTSGAARR